MLNGKLRPELQIKADPDAISDFKIEISTAHDPNPKHDPNFILKMVKIFTLA